MKSFEELVSEAESRRFEGWDFTYLRGRLVEEPIPWDYRRIISGLLPDADSLVDIGTGGGELLSSLHPLPTNTLAIEGYHPNVSVAKRRLQPLNVEVIETGCDDNDNKPQRGALPFTNDAVGLVIDRHEAFVASEVFRVLKPGGHFVTQQVGGSCYPELNAALGKPGKESKWNLKEAIRQVERAGLVQIESYETELGVWFQDIGAVVYQLKAVPWQIVGFSVKKYDRELRELDSSIRRNGPFRVTLPLFLLHARKPG